MPERPTHNGFVAFVPPPARPRVETPPPHGEPAIADTAHIVTDPTPVLVPEAQIEHQAQDEVAPDLQPEEVEAVEYLPPTFIVQACEHDTLIRSEAIRLAAIACGRALRHAAVIHPQLIATFVDEALEAAGAANGAIVATRRDVSEFGSVAIAFGDAGIGADIDTRAALLVRAAAST